MAYRRCLCSASLTTQTAILATTLSAYQAHLQTAAPLLARLVAFPTRGFPGTEAEKVGLVQTLLRKKLGGEAEAWVEEGGRGGKEIAAGGGAGDGDGDGGRGGERGELEGLWAWAGPEANRLARGYRWGVGGEGEDEDEEMGEGESEEEEEDEEGSEEDEEGGAMEGKMVTRGGEGADGVVVKDEEGGEEGKDPLALEEVLRFMTTGRRPGS